MVGIMRTHPCKLDPLELHFYIIKLGFTGVYMYIIFLIELIFAHNIDSGCLLESLHRDSSNEVTIYVLSKNEKKKNEKLSF